jgi:hypothetical protein
MASSSITLYSSNAASQAFSLVSSSVDKTVWKVANRPLSNALQLELTRKLTSGNKNDHVIIRLSQVEANATTSQKATAQVLVDISVPKDQSILTPTVIVGLLGMVSSLLDDGTALQATSANRSAIADGRDI